MKIKRWWYQKSGQAKAITALSVLLILQIGLCFSTETVTSWATAIFHLHRSDDPMESLGLMVWQGVFCVVTLVLIVVAGVFWLPGLSSGSKGSRKDTDD